MTFRGIRKDYVTVLRGRRRPSWAPRKRNILTIPGLAGGLLTSTDILPRPEDVPILIEGNSITDLQRLKEDLADWLITDKAEELIFDDEPDRIYYAIVDGSFDPEEIVKMGRGVINFICPDPYKYGSEKFVISTNLAAPINLLNEGTAETPPIFTVTLKDSTTYLDIIGENDYMRIGQPARVEESVVPQKELVLWDELGSTTGWTAAQSADIDGAVVAGTMSSNGYQLQASSFGTGASWHGPALIKSIGQNLTDFEIEMILSLKNDDYKKIGRVELYILDANKQAVCKLALKDNFVGTDGNYAELRVGDKTTNHFLINERGDAWDTWLNFEGILRISRVGNKWSAYVSKFVNGQHTARREAIPFIDINNQYTRKPAYVVVHLGANGAYTPSPMNIQDLKVYKINTLANNQVPTIGQAGDVFKFDFKTSKILKNGELFTRKDFGARFFQLQKGNNVLVFNPPEVIQEVKAEWRGAYL
jgi:predicted phage tail component-like protein